MFLYEKLLMVQAWMLIYGNITHGITQCENNFYAHFCSTESVFAEQ